MFEGTLNGRVALVTGASRGIGRATALALAEAGADVALVGRDRGRLEETAREVEARGRRALPIVHDVCEPGAGEALRAATTASLGAVSLLVNNAGSAESGPFVESDPGQLERMLSVHVRAVFDVTRSLLPAMLKAGFGRVVQVASVAGKTGAPYVTAYVAAKHAQVGFTRALALEVAGRGVTVNAVCPSYVDTEMTARNVAALARRTGRDEEEVLRLLLTRNPQKRLVTPDEVAHTVVFLCTDAARGINGQALPICGGEVLT